MRTTIELPDEQRARLVELAARQGRKGFSGIIQEALTRYFEALDGRDDRVRDALAVLGTLDEEAAVRMQEEHRRLRASWR